MTRLLRPSIPAPLLNIAATPKKIIVSGNLENCSTCLNVFLMNAKINVKKFEYVILIKIYY